MFTIKNYMSITLGSKEKKGKDEDDNVLHKWEY